jgi:hypothetical protein
MAASTPPRADIFWNDAMMFRRFSLLLPVAACALALALSGCAAAPLAEMAMTQMAAKPACPAGAACQPSAGAGSFGDISKSFSDSLHKFTSLVSESQAVPPVAPAPGK